MPRLAKVHPDVLTSSRVLIFGGTSGIGAAVTSAVLANGGKLVVSSSNKDNISAAVTHLKSVYPEATVSGAVGDLSNSETIEANIKTVLDTAVKVLGGPLDHIVYTAGDSNVTRLMLSAIEARDTFKEWTVRFQGPLMLSKLIAANPGVYLKAETSSSITFTSGCLAHKPAVGVNAAWAGAMEAMARSFSKDFAPIRVNAVAPGFIQTELLDQVPPETLAQWGNVSLAKRVGKPEEAAEAYLFCMRCGFYTGQTLLVDGGYVHV